MRGANQHRRDLTASQRAAVAVELIPRITEDVNRKRIEKLEQTLARKTDSECMENSPDTQEPTESPIRSRAIAGDIMGVNDNYVGLAKRLKEASPELFEQLRAGDVTLSGAIKRLAGVTDGAHATRIKAVRRRLNRILRDVEQSPAFLDRLEALVADFTGT